MTVINTIV